MGWKDEDILVRFKGKVWGFDGKLCVKVPELGLRHMVDTKSSVLKILTERQLRTLQVAHFRAEYCPLELVRVESSGRVREGAVIDVTMNLGSFNAVREYQDAMNATHDDPRRDEGMSLLALQDEVWVRHCAACAERLAA